MWETDGSLETKSRKLTIHPNSKELLAIRGALHDKQSNIRGNGKSSGQKPPGAGA
jgi:hypothetical protein